MLFHSKEVLLFGWRVYNPFNGSPIAITNHKIADACYETSTIFFLKLLFSFTLTAQSGIQTSVISFPMFLDVVDTASRDVTKESGVVELGYCTQPVHVEGQAHPLASPKAADA